MARAVRADPRGRRPTRRRSAPAGRPRGGTSRPARPSRCTRTPPGPAAMSGARAGPAARPDAAEDRRRRGRAQRQRTPGFSWPQSIRPGRGSRHQPPERAARRLTPRCPSVPIPCGTPVG
ncbi:MAG: hypothetical protein FJ221_13335 [Lentisphaerae bacterium]|nr:hypothetical protein [Lentisphaerota bacterium]